MPHQRSTDQFELKPAQQRVLGVLKSEGSSRLTRARYEELSGVSRSQAAYDLAELVENGVLQRVGSGRATRYRIVHLSTPGRNGRRRWTQERIHAALEQFCAGRGAWPSATEFKQAGRFDLYVAASRYGGIRFWTSELGLTRASQAPPPAARSRRRTFRPRLQWAAAAAVAALALLLGGAGHVRLSPGSVVLEAAPPALLHASLKPPTIRQRTRYLQPRQTKPASRPTRARRAQHASTASASTELASLQSSAPARAAAPTRTTNPSPASSSNRAPLPAPSGGNTRSPLPPPGS